MAAPPAKKGRMENFPEKKESTTIMTVLEQWAEGQTEQVSPVHRINGFPFRLILRRCVRGSYYVELFCDKGNEAELWKCTTTFEWDGSKVEFSFCSWYVNNYCLGITENHFKAGSTVQVTITIKDDGKSWSSRLRPTLDSTKPPDGILVIGDEEKEIQVNKKFLASQSPYFDRLFFGNFKEKDMDKIPIGDVEYEEFNNIIKMVYGSGEAALTNEIVHRVLDLADRFELKIVEDKVVSFVFSDNRRDRYTLAQKLLMSEERNLPSLKNLCLNECSNLREMGNVKKSPEYADLSDALKLEYLDRALDLALGYHNAN